ncbi:MAG TPA: AEC family transporter [Chloroflexota bacterium]|nr:AEC family transporter [Chloroflexota bacterium]
MHFLSNLSLPQNVLQTIAAIFLLLLVGYGAKRAKILKQSDTSVVNAIIIYLTMPAFIFSVFHKKPLPDGVWATPVVVLVGEMVVLALAYGCARLLKLDRPTTGGLMVAAAFGNTGFLGYPVTTAVWPHQPGALVTSVMIDSFGMSMWLMSIGIAVAATFASAKFDRRSMLAFLKTPLFPSTVIALLIRNCNVPEPIVISARYLGAATVPLAMISLGLSLSARSIRKTSTPFLVCLLLKVAVLPVLVHFGLKPFGVTGLVHDAAVLEASMPSAVMAGVVSGQYGANGPFVSGAVFLMTLFSLATIPLVLTILH